jgi:hypothetical protein
MKNIDVAFHFQKELGWGERERKQILLLHQCEQKFPTKPEDQHSQILNC